MDGILIGPESEQKTIENFNYRVDHISENGEIKHKPEGIIESKTIHESKFLKLKEIDNYVFAERKNIDSLSFVLFATNVDDEKRIGLTYDFQPSINKSIIKAFTCSIDDPEVSDLKNLIIIQVKKQAGFIVGKSEIQYLGKCLVTSKMNEFCHLFGVAVDKTRQVKRDANDTLKNNSGHYWSTNESVQELEDWKAQLIVYRRFLSKKSHLMIKKVES